MKAIIDAAIAAGRRPRRVASPRTVLATGHGEAGRKSYVVLADANGRLTAAGRHYYEATGQARPNPNFDRDTPLIHRGTGDWIRTGQGEQLVRRPLSNSSCRSHRVPPAFPGWC